MLVIILSIVVFTLVLLVYSSCKPDTFRIERDIVIHARAEKVFPLINDFNQWVHWSPYEKMDVDMVRTYEGAASGKGAVYGWQGNNKVGSGCMVILESVPLTKIVIKLDFMKPMEAHNQAEFTLQQQDDTTRVTWAMTGPHTITSKIFHTIFKMDKMIGNQFLEGLENMKQVAEGVSPG